MEIIVPVESLFEERYGHIVCYPKCDPEVLKRRIKEIKEVGIRAIVFSGDKMVDGIPLLGKGCTGVVLAALSDNNHKVALKILRTDVEPRRLLHEAEMLRIANSVDVGPKLLKYSESLLLTEYIEGGLLPKWVKGLSRDEEGAPRRLSRVLRDILEQCWRLDSIGLDHGELSWADKHIIVDARDKPHILDFESASNRRKTSNVTSISQYLFIRGRTAETIAQKFRRLDADSLIQALKAYKAKRTREQFECILRITGLQSEQKDL
ncbi:MAG: serine/threonine protein kinase [Candidatus Bathyarchaeia archaeon]